MAEGLMITLVLLAGVMGTFTNNVTVSLAAMRR